MGARSLLTLIVFVLIGVILITVVLAVYDGGRKDFNIPRIAYGGVLTTAVASLGLVGRALAKSRAMQKPEV
ncbi:MAG: hypothetical protein ACRDKF_03835 [Actinomycetota bacterium]